MLFDFIKRFWAIHPLSFFPWGGGSTKYQIPNSLRFRASNSAYLSRTSGASPTDQKKCTYSFFIKATPSTPLFSGTQYAFVCSASNNGIIGVNNGGYSGKFFVRSDSANDVQYPFLLRDPSGHVHIHVAIDTTQATASDRIKVWKSGEQQTSSAGTFPTINSSTYLNVASTAYSIFRDITNAIYTDGVLSNFYFIDGQALTPSSFGETNGDGVWVPKAYTGTYGNNGFYLPFSDTSGLTSGANSGLGKDFSGNGNYWNTNGISLTAGATYDAFVDTPTNNYCTLNPIYRGTLTSTSYGAFSAGSLRHSYESNLDCWSVGTIGVSSGKWYFEAEVIAGGSSASYQSGVGVAELGFDHSNDTAGVAATEYIFNCYSTQKFNNNTSSAYGDGTALANGDILGVALDCDNGAIYFRKNGGAWYNSGDPTSGVTRTGAAFTWTGGSKTMFPCSSPQGGSVPILDWTFGQRPFGATAPAGFRSLCTANLPAVAITKPKAHFDINTRSGTGASATKTGLLFQPDFAWIKARSAATDHKLTDSVRGATKALISDGTGAETTDANGVTAFTSDGYTVGSDTNYNNSTGPVTYVDWLWKAGGTPTTDNVAGVGATPTAGSVKIDGANLGSALAGTIAATRLSANTTAGFSIVTWTGNSTNGATVAHGLGVVPKMVIVKQRTNGGNSWRVYHESGNASPGTGSAYLNLTSGWTSDSLDWNNTAPSSTVITLGTTIAVNVTANTYVAYCFAEIPGYSKFGSYTGNAAADGTFVYCGFRPKYIMAKRTNTTGSWVLYDTVRNTYNLVDSATLLADTANSEATNGSAWGVDIVSNGFKFRVSVDPNNGTYIFAAFAEHPLGGSNVSPCPAR